MGLSATVATMSQDRIDPVGRLSIVRRPSQERRGYQGMVNI